MIRSVGGAYRRGGDVSELEVVDALEITIIIPTLDTIVNRLSWLDS